MGSGVGAGVGHPLGDRGGGGVRCEVVCWRGSGPRRGGQEGRDRLEWGQEGGAVLGRLDREDGNGAGSQV